MKTTYTNMKPLNQHEKKAMLTELEDDTEITEIGCGNILMLRDEISIRIFTVVKEEIITDE